ncbi:MAG: hypothetical protein J5598_00550 [Clostridia bacterium]|nr:hypothetical protein [Clostridia bacterium]
MAKQNILVLHRRFRGPDYTIGKLYWQNGSKEVYICDILEDTVRNKLVSNLNNFVKVFGKTAIPYGTYEIVRSYSNRFKRNLPLLLNVPHFEGVRIHAGNTADDTEGCLLPGFNRVKGKVVDSRKAFKDLDDRIVKWLKTGKVYIQIVD